MIYLDYTAHTPVDPAVLDAYTQAALEYGANANSTHAAGRAAKKAVDDALEGIAGMFGVSAEELILTSGASEANNLAIKGIARAQRHQGKHIISTGLEHSSVSGALTALQEQGWEIDLAQIREDGKIDLDDVRDLIRKDTVLVSVCAVDSELGTIQPLKELAEIVKEYPNCRFHVDATQAVGKLALKELFGGQTEAKTGDFTVLPDGIDLVTFAPHKFFGLLGSGLLVKRKGLILDPQISGGVSTSIYRSGTPDTAAAVALEKALQLSLENESQRSAYVRELNSYLREKLQEFKGVRINSPEGAVPYILNVSVKGIRGEKFHETLDAHGVCVSVKSACSVKGTPSRAVMAVSHDRNNALSSWRISLSYLTTKTELEEFIEIFGECLKELQ